MNTEKISESGSVTEIGQLMMPMDRLNAFFKANKGKRIVVRFYAAEHGSSKLQQAYYYNYVIPTIQAALYEQGTRMGEKSVDKWLVGNYPGDKSEQEIGIGDEIIEARNFTKNQMSDFLDWLKQFAAENLSVYIEDPKTL